LCCTADSTFLITSNNYCLLLDQCLPTTRATSQPPEEFADDAPHQPKKEPAAKRQPGHTTPVTVKIAKKFR
jgi:hypothetical protein